MHTAFIIVLLGFACALGYVAILHLVNELYKD